MRRSVRAALGATLVVSALVGYVTLDVYDQVPGVLTLAPEPNTAAPTPFASPRASVPIPTPTAGMPLRPAGADAPVPNTAGLTAALAPVLAGNALGPDVAVVVRDAATGGHLVDVQADSPHAPASTLKLLSAVGVLQGLGATTTLDTKVVAGADPSRIVLVVGGDSLLEPGAGRPDQVAGRAGLADLAAHTAAALAAAGTSAVTLAVDASYAEGPASAPTWPPSFLATGITGPVAMAGLSTHRATPNHPGATDPVGEVLSTFAARLREHQVTVSVAPQPLPAEAGLGARAGGSPTPGAAAAAASATPAPTPSTSPAGAPAPGTTLAVVSSAPVVDQLVLALQESDNGLTETLARQAAFRATGARDFAGVAAYLISQAQALGLDVTGSTLYDASGLTRDARLPARLLADVLMLAGSGKVPGLADVVRELPVAALSGTLADRFTDPRTQAGVGVVRAKTGTLTGVSSLAGTVVTADGRPLVFVVLGAAPQGTPEARLALDQLAAVLATCGCRPSAGGTP